LKNTVGIPILVKGVCGELGIDDPSEETAVELLKKVLAE
jgi:hypothetical protein